MAVGGRLETLLGLGVTRWVTCWEDPLRSGDARDRPIGRLDGTVVGPMFVPGTQAGSRETVDTTQSFSEIRIPDELGLERWDRSRPFGARLGRMPNRRSMCVLGVSMATDGVIQPSNEVPSRP